MSGENHYMSDDSELYNELRAMEAEVSKTSIFVDNLMSVLIYMTCIGVSLSSLPCS